MKDISLLLISFLIYLGTKGQEKGAEIEISNFNVYENGDKYKMNCYVNYIKEINNNKSYFLVALIKVPNSPLQLVQFEDNNEKRNDYYLLDRRNTDYLFNLFPYRRIINRFVLYLILIEGNASAIAKAINVSQNEFYKIEEALDFFYKLKFRPLTYTSINK